MRKQFTFYRSFWEAIQIIPKEEQTAVLLAVCAYALDDIEPELSGTSLAIFKLMRPTLDSARRKAESGRKGGERHNDAADLPPTLDEVVAYALSLDNQTAPECAGPFWDYYSKDGWTIGSSKIKNWKSLFRGWVYRETENQY